MSLESNHGTKLPKIAFIPHWNVFLLDMSSLRVRSHSDIAQLDHFIRTQFAKHRQHSTDTSDKPTCLVNYDEFSVDDALVSHYASWVRRISEDLYGHVVRYSLKTSSPDRDRATTVQMANWRDQGKSLIPGYLHKLQDELTRLHVMGERIFGEGDMLQGKLAAYLLTDKLSQGTFGLVRRAQVVPLGGEEDVHEAPARCPHSSVAIKCMLVSTIELLDMVDFIDREIEMMQLLRGCEHIVQIVESVKSEESVFIVMEMLKNVGPGNVSLGAMDDSRDRLDEETARNIFRQLARAIDTIQDHGIIHRDLQLGNICFDAKTGKLKVIDFGAAAWIHDPDTKQPHKHTILCGNIRYCSPEMISQHGYSLETDIFSAGVVLYKLLTGFHPFRYARDALEGRFSLKCVDDDTSPNRRVRFCDTCDLVDNDPVFVSTKCRNLLYGMLEPDPAQRLSIKQILNHPWLCSNEDHDDK